MDKKSRIKVIVGKSFAALCSLYIPGLGQLLGWQWRWAIGLFCFPIITNIILQQMSAYDYLIMYNIQILMIVAIHSFSAVHAYNMDTVPRSNILKLILFLFMIKAHAFAFYASRTAEFPFRYMLIDEAEKPSQTLLGKDEILIFRRDSYRPEEGEIWVFKNADGDFLLRQTPKDDYWYPFGQPLYILWSPDRDRIGKRLDEVITD